MSTISTQGIIFADLFVNSKEDFVEYFTQYFETNRTAVEAAITDLENVLNLIQTKTLNVAYAEQFHKAWKTFQNVVLLNTNNLELIVGYRDPGKTSIQFSTIIDMETATKDRNLINTGDQLVRDSMSWSKASEKAQKVEKIMQSHLGGFINSLYSRLSEDEKHLLITKNFDAIPEVWKHPRAGDTLIGQRWQDIFYKQYYTGQGLGKAYDAYMNHLANYHTEFYSYLATGGTSSSENENIPSIKHSVYNEEGGAGNNFPILLNESLNTTGWYTGGDIIIIDPKTMEVVYNIQLKTTQEGVTKKGNVKIPKKFDIAIAKLKIYINGGDLKIGDKTFQFSPLSSLPPREKASQLFDLLKTNISNTNAFDGAVQGTIDNLIKTGISEKIQKQFKINLKFN